MLDKLKGLWSQWKVYVSVVGGILVLSSVYGTCSYEPPTVSEAEVTPAASTTPATTTSVEVSTTVDNETTENGGTSTDTTNETTTTNPTATETATNYATNPANTNQANPSVHSWAMKAQKGQD